jgi:hypothetical protein
MNLNELREYQVDFEKIRNIDSTEIKELYKLRAKFVKDYPLKNILSLSIDGYIIGKKLPSFCHRIENELNAWGNIHGSTAKKFGLYFGTDGDDKDKKYRIGKAAFGSSTEKAFENIKSCIFELIDNKNNIKVLKKNIISPMFKGKILSIYHPDEFLNIFSATHLNYFINALSLENSSKSELDKQATLLEFKNNDIVMKHWSIIEYSQFLYHSFGKPTNEKDNSAISNELNTYKLKDFPPIESVKAKFIDLQITNHTSRPKTKSNQPPQKIDYAERSKKFKRIGDRGEQIVVMTERLHLLKKGRADLAEKVDHIAKRDDSVGYDIKSYELNGEEKYIEVKSTLKPAGVTDIYISANELSVAQSMSNYFIYVVYDVNHKEPHIWKIKGNEFLTNPNIEMKPISYKIKFKTE